MILNDAQVRAVLLDMDGVLWRGGTPLPGLSHLFGVLHSHQLPFRLVTNNSSKTPAQYLSRFADFGITVQLEHILSSAIATASYLQATYPAGSKIYVVGETGIRHAVQEAGFRIAPDSSQSVTAVVGGVDFGLSYDSLKDAALLIQRGADFIGTNGDLTFPIEDGLAPGAGSILAALTAATGVRPTIIGKPERRIFDIALGQLGVAPEQAVMVGDRLETDVLGGQNAGIRTILVETGVDNRDTIVSKGITPDLVLPSIVELREQLMAVNAT